MRILRPFKMAALGILRHVSVTVPARIGGSSFKVPLIETIGLGHLRPSEPELQTALAALLPTRAGAFIDVGANIGQTLLKVRSIDASRRYVGFEPNPACFAYVQRLIDENRFVDAVCIPTALGQSDSMVQLFLNSSIDACASTTPAIRRPDYYTTSVTVVQRTGDSVVADLGITSVAMLKIDVEGAELDVLLGFQKTIDQSRPLVCIEVLPPLKGAPEQTVNARLALARGISEWATAHRYAIHAVRKDGSLGPTGPFDSDSQRTTNFIMVPA